MRGACGPAQLWDTLALSVPAAQDKGQRASWDLPSKHRIRWCPAALCYLLGADAELQPWRCCCPLRMAAASWAGGAGTPARAQGGRGSRRERWEKKISILHTHTLSYFPPCFFHCFFFLHMTNEKGGVGFGERYFVPHPSSCCLPVLVLNSILKKAGIKATWIR